MQTLSFQQPLTWTVNDTKTNTSEELSFKKSQHVSKRVQQRSIDSETLQLAIEYGKAYFKQGLIFYVYGKKQIPKHLSDRKNKKNLVVVVSTDDNTIVTCYQHNNPFKYVKKKGKQFMEYS